jgi:HD-GYP domain-containing protein (c-di-GMP phosphodiesterase class II)
MDFLLDHTAFRTPDLLQAIIDALSANIAVVNADGRILTVNAAWRRYADDNGSAMSGYGVGLCYLHLCDPDCCRLAPQVGEDDLATASQVATGIVAVIEGRLERFQITYPCHSPDRRRWFLLTVTPLDWNGGRCAIVAHEDISTVKQAEQDMAAALTGTIEAIAHVLDVRDPYTAGHGRNVAYLAQALARELGLSKDRQHTIFLGATIHDIGKIAIPAEILTRPAQLSRLEMELVRAHCRVGHRIVANIPFPWPLADIVLHHHERQDGSGYPDQLLGEQISLESRIVAVADVADAIASHRPYRPAKGLIIANMELRKAAGQGFDAEVVAAYLSPAVQAVAQGIYVGDRVPSLVD